MPGETCPLNHTISDTYQSYVHIYSLNDLRNPGRSILQSPIIRRSLLRDHHLARLWPS